MKYIAAIVLLVMLCSAQTDNSKTWFKFEGCSTGATGAAACFFFMEDKETHTRCYAFRVMYHDGAAISCVKQ